MKSRTSFVLLSTLWGLLTYLVISLGLAAIFENTGSQHPHGFPGIMYLLMPIIYGPIGAILGLIFGLVEKLNRMGKVLINIGASVFIVSAATVGLLALML